MASITSIRLPRSRTAVLQRTSARFSTDGSSKAAQKANGGSGSAIIVRIVFQAAFKTQSAT